MKLLNIMIILFKLGGMNLEISKSSYNGCYAPAFSTSQTHMTEHLTLQEEWHFSVSRHAQTCMKVMNTCSHLHVHTRTPTYFDKLQMCQHWITSLRCGGWPFNGLCCSVMWGEASNWIWTKIWALNITVNGWFTQHYLLLGFCIFL